MTSVPWSIAEQSENEEDDEEAVDASEAMYSDEYIQSIYTAATSSSIANAASSAGAAPTAATKRVSIAAEPEDEPDDAEPTAASSYLRPVPPAMRNNASPVRNSLASTAPPPAIRTMQQQQQQQQLPSSSSPARKPQQPPPEVVKQSPPRYAALHKPAAATSAAAASNTTMTNPASLITSLAGPPAPAAVHFAVDRNTSESRKAPPTFDDDEPPPAATGPFVVPVPRSSKQQQQQQHGSRSNLTGAAAASSNTSSGGGRPPAPVRSNSNISGNGGILALFWNRVFRRYYAMKLFGMLLAIYTAVLSFTYTGTFGRYGGVLDRETGYIIDPNSEENTENGVIVRENGGVARAVVATTSWELVFLAIARLTAFYMYPALVMVFLTKFRATMQLISKTPLSLFTYEDLHELHVFSGWTILVNGLAHTAFHLARLGSQENWRLLWRHFSGVSGLVVTVAMCLVCLPMLVYKKEVRYEIRKGLHYFFIVFCLGMCFHAPTSAFPNGGFSTWGFTILIIWWILDFSYCHMFMTEKIESTIFHVVPTGVQLTMRVSERFQKTGVRGGYCYVNFPWLSRYEWHAFSLFENPANPAERQIFMEKLGDWTSKLHKTLQRDTSRPIWVQGPFSSPYDSADDYDHQILVAGGIGITPALSVMRAHKSSRRTNLIWAVRDPHMLEFFLRRAEFSERGWNLIFYTGKEKTYVGDQSDIITSTGARVHIIKSRPDFNQLIPNLIYSIESKKSVPEAYIPDAKIEAIQFLKERLLDLDEESYLTNQDKIRALVEDAESFGFLFTDLVTEFFGEDVSLTLQESIRIAEGSYLMGKTSNDSERSSTKEMKPLMGKGSRGRVDNHGADKRSTIANEEQILAGLRKVERGQSVRFLCESPGTPRNASLRNLVRGLSLRNISCRNIVNYERMMGPRQESMTTRAWKAVTLAADEWAKEHVPTFKPWEEDPTEAKAYLKGMDPEILKCWGMLYCGGKSPLAANASKAATDFGLDMHMESFAW